jgi:predicted amidohydrolase YtcJ
MPESDTLALVNGHLMIHDPAKQCLQPYPAATAILVEDGRIAAIGDDRTVLHEGHQRSEVLDLHGGTVVPGFIDAHIHAFHCAIGSLRVSLLPSAVSSIGELERRLSDHSSSAAAGAWVIGEGYDDMRLREQRHPTRADLDEAVPDHPAVITRVCGHMSVANSLGLKTAGIDRDTPDPSGGTIVRDATGSPTGLLLERAQHLVTSHIPTPDVSDIARALASTGRALISLGITTICEALLGGSHPLEIPIWTELLAHGWEGPDVTCLLNQSLTEDLASLKPLNVVGTKLFADGVVTGRTAAVSEPFQNGSDTGMLIHPSGGLAELARAAAARGLPVGIHAMGDRAIETSIEAIKPLAQDNTTAAKRAVTSAAPSPPYRIEHCSLPSQTSLRRMHALGIVPVPQPGFLFAEGEAYRQQLGDQRVRRAYPLRTMIRLGLRPALSSDAPATSSEEAFNPWIGISAAATRRTWAGTRLGDEEVISVAEAMACYTANAAAALALQHRTGSLATGKDADLVVFQQDPNACRAPDLISLRPKLVLVKGRTMLRELD